MHQTPEPVSAPTLGDEQAVRRQLTTGLLKIGMAARHHAWAGSESRGLSPTQGQILMFLLHRDGEQTRLSDVASGLAVTQPTASVAIRTLIEKGLVARERSAADGRAVTLCLTPSGRTEAAHARGWTDFLATSLDELDEQEQAVFQRSVVKMIRAMQLKGEIPISRMCATCIYFQPNRHPGEPHPHHCAYVDAPFGDRQLRLDCADFQPASPEAAQETWNLFAGEPRP
jgi:DNA-binding MarR family transcriptional regulator